MLRFCFALVNVYDSVVPHFDSSVKGFSADSNTCVLRVSMPLSPMSKVPAPGSGLPQGCERFCQKSPFG